jgi:hypothetical protein
MRTGISEGLIEFRRQYRREVVFPQHVAFGDRFSRASFDVADIYAQRGVRIPAISIGKFRSNFVKFEAFGVQEFDHMTLFQFHRFGTFPFLMIHIPAMPAILSRGNPKLSQ